MKTIFKPSYYNFYIDAGNCKNTLVFNSVSGAIIEMESDVAKKLSRGEMFDGDGKYDELLNKQGIIVPFDKDEFNALVYDRQVYVYDQSPKLLGFVIAPSMACNLNCSYCFERGFRDAAVMTQKTWDDVYRFILKRVETHPTVEEVSIAWFGGEPCLQLDAIERFSRKLIQSLQENSIEYQARIITNGVLLSKETARRLAQCGVKKAQVTVDGLAPNYAIRKGCAEEVFYTVMDNIKAASEHLHINLRINIDKNNISDVMPLLRLLLDTHELVGKINVTPAVIRPWNDEDRSDYLTGDEYVTFLYHLHNTIIQNGWGNSFAPKRPARRLSSCGSIRNTNATIDPNGFLYRCEHCLNRPEWSIGNVVSGELYNEPDNRFMEFVVFEKCKKCKGFPICVGGCAASRLIHQVEPEFCEAYEEIIRENVRFAVLSKKAKACGLCSSVINPYESMLTPWGYDYKRKEE